MEEFQYVPPDFFSHIWSEPSMLHGDNFSHQWMIETDFFQFCESYLRSSDGENTKSFTQIWNINVNHVPLIDLTALKWHIKHAPKL